MTCMCAEIQGQMNAATRAMVNANGSISCLSETDQLPVVAYNGG